jgi:UDP-N-acetylmuramate dehydrogenase
MIGTMPLPAGLVDRLTAIPQLNVLVNEPLAGHTRFGIGGPAAVFCEAHTRQACAAVLLALEQSSAPRVVVGGGTNLVVADAGFDGVVLRYSESALTQNGNSLHVEAGATLQEVVDRSIELGLKGMETMTGIPGSLGGALYGNAGAYGHSIQEVVVSVTAAARGEIREFNNEECRFRYRESTFKQHREWMILATELRFTPADAAELARTATGIRTVRDAKYPPTMKCAGSIFKNLLYAELPARAQAEVPPGIVREGKVPSAWFLEQVGAKGFRRGDIQVATYHANLIYNDGAGTASDLVEVIAEFKRLVRDRFGLDLEEEIQYVGFADVASARL